MTLEHMVERIAKMPAEGPNADVILEARAWVDAKDQEKKPKQETEIEG